MYRAFVGLGSNLADPHAQLRRAVQALADLAGSRLCAVSGVYRSAAIGPGRQPDYLNAAARLETALAPLALLDALQAIEAHQGRVREVRWGPRTLDLDLLLYGDLELDHPRLRLPHPRLAERDFVLLPLAELAEPEMLLPGGVELGTLAANCPRNDLRKTELTLE